MMNHNYVVYRDADPPCVLLRSGDAWAPITAVVLSQVWTGSEGEAWAQAKELPDTGARVLKAATVGLRS